MLNAVLFDGAGTLFHTREPAGVSYAKMAARFGLEADERLITDSLRRVFAAAPGLAFGPGIEPARLRELEREWWRRLVRTTFAGIGTFSDFNAYFDALFAFFADPANWVCDPEAPMLLAALRESGLKLGVVSNFDHRIYRILEALGLSRYFESVTISSEAGYAKPSPEIFRIALAHHAVAPAQALHVGDSETLDGVGARAAGIAVVLVDPDAFAARSAQLKTIGAPNPTAPAAHSYAERSEQQMLSCGERCVRVSSLGGTALALGKFGF